MRSAMATKVLRVFVAAASSFEASNFDEDASWAVSRENFSSWESSL